MCGQLRKDVDSLSRRERQIMDVIVRRGEASARKVWEEVPDAPGYSSIRKLLSVMEAKGLVRHYEKDGAYTYSATKSRSKLAESALHRLRDTFFQGSTEQVVSGLLKLRDTKLDPREFSRIAAMIEEARQRQDSDHGRNSQT